MNVRTKFEVRSFTRSWDNRGYFKNWAVPGYADAPFSPKCLTGFCSMYWPNLNVNVNENLYSANSRRSNRRRWRSGVWVTRREHVIGRSKQVRFKTGLESSKTVRRADIQRKRVPVIRRRYTKSSRCKRRLRTGRNSKKVRVSGSQSSRRYIEIK